MNYEYKEARKLIEEDILNSKREFTVFDGAFLAASFLVVLSLIVSKVV